MSSAIPGRVALVGSGVIGRGWIRVFARVGAEVVLYDSDPRRGEAALAWLRDDLAASVDEGSITQVQASGMAALVTAEADLAKALQGVDYVQESVPEDLALKQAVFAELDRLAAPETILASSTSALPIDEIVAQTPGARRCVMAHPFNPAHLMPAVEMLGASTTDPAVLQQACDWLSACGQIPIRMNRYVKGFLGNRIQAALIREAMHLVESGVADALAVDAVIRDALALRWATVGNFGANHTNAVGGIAEYFAMYGDSYRTLMADLDSAAPKFHAGTLAAIGEAIEAREEVENVAGLCRKRDRLVGRVNGVKAEG